MGAVDTAQDRVDDLRALLASVRAARAGVPSLRRPTSAVGARGTWTGSAADRLHDDELSPLTDRLRFGLERAEQAVLDELGHAERALGRAEALEDAAEREAARS